MNRTEETVDVKVFRTDQHDTCRKCKYFSQRETAIKNENVPVKGSCLRYPPQIVMDSKGAFRSQWPKISSETRACGEFVITYTIEQSPIFDISKYVVATGKPANL